VLLVFCLDIEKGIKLCTTVGCIFQLIDLIERDVDIELVDVLVFK